WNTWVWTTWPSACGPVALLSLLPPAAVLTPKLPCQLPKTLMNRMPNQLEKLRLLLAMLAILALAVASPEVALPAWVLRLTRAFPLWAFSLTLLLMAEFVVEFTLVSLAGIAEAEQLPPPRAAAVE